LRISTQAGNTSGFSSQTSIHWAISSFCAFFSGEVWGGGQEAGAVLGGDHLAAAIARSWAVARAHRLRVNRQHIAQVALQIRERLLPDSRVGLGERQPGLAQQIAQVAFRNGRQRAQRGLPFRFADGRSRTGSQEFPQGLFPGLFRHAAPGNVAWKAAQQSPIERMAQHHGAAMGVQWNEWIDVPPQNRERQVIPAETHQHSDQGDPEAGVAACEGETE
jgi:hypothetical protein